MIKAVIFDIGGVLAYDVWEYLLLDEKSGIVSICNLDMEQVQRVGQNLWEKFACRAAIGEDGWKELEFHLSMSVNDFIQLTGKFIRPVQGMAQLLDHLQSEGIDLAICSNGTEFWFKRQLDRLDLHRFFRATRVILSSRIGVLKSSPRFEMLQATVNALGIGKDFCIFVDDREENIQQALRFGLAGILFPSHSKCGAQYLEALLEKMGVL
jgi:HAD superfamily hydrolase (TIGR01509 family)